MRKQVFLANLRKGLSGLPEADIEERVTFYSEMIDDRMEEGLSEEEAVAAAGSVEDIVAQVVAETPFSKLAKEKIKPQRRLKAWEIVLLVLGSPIWLSLLVAAFAVLISLYAVLWSVIISVWAVFAAMAGCAVGGIAASIVLICGKNGLSGIAMVGASLVCAGLSIFLFFGCKAVTQGVLLLTKKIVLGIKNRFVKKEGA